MEGFKLRIQNSTGIWRRGCKESLSIGATMRMNARPYETMRELV